MPLDNLKEEGGTILDGLGEDLEQVAIFVKVDENVQFLDLQGGESDKGREGGRLHHFLIEKCCTI